MFNIHKRRSILSDMTCENSGGRSENAWIHQIRQAENYLVVLMFVRLSESLIV